MKVTVTLSELEAYAYSEVAGSTLDDFTRLDGVMAGDEKRSRAAVRAHHKLSNAIERAHRHARATRSQV